MNDQDLNNGTFSGSPQYESPGVSSTPPPRYVTYIPYGYTPKTYEEKKGVKKCALIVGIYLIKITTIKIFCGKVYYIFLSG